MLATDGLTESEWQTAHAIAQTLVKAEADVNELGKAIAYLRAIGDAEDAGSRFFKYINTLVEQGKTIGHSQKTGLYYQSIEDACKKYLKLYENNAQTMLQILGWAARLMRYYQNAGPIGEITAPVSARQLKIEQINKSNEWAIDQILDATVIGIKGNFVRYDICGIHKKSKEPKKAKDLNEGQQVKVKVTELKDDGSIKHVKYVDIPPD